MTPLESKPDDAATGLPGLRTWPAVYVFVLAAFVFWIILLVALTRAFSREKPELIKAAKNPEPNRTTKVFSLSSPEGGEGRGEEAFGFRNLRGENFSQVFAKFHLSPALSPLLRRGAREIDPGVRASSAFDERHSFGGAGEDGA